MLRICRTVAAMALTIGVLAPAELARAGGADVVAAEAERTGDTWRFAVTVAHGDTGWEHYADAWRIVGEDGTVYGTRPLAHPHVTEQPFTRSLSGVRIPDDVGVVLIEARDKVHGWSGERLELALPR